MSEVSNSKRFCAILHGDGTHEDTPWIVHDSLGEMENQMNDYSVEHNYRSYGPQDHYTELGFPYQPHESREDFYRRFRRQLELAVNYGYLSVKNGDAWICVTDAVWEGYGHVSDNNPWEVDDDGKKSVFLGAAVDVMGQNAGWVRRRDHKYVTGIFTIHELGHIYGSHHHHGTYEVKSSERFNTSPMGAAYVCNEGTDRSWHSLSRASSTCYAGSGWEPNGFCEQGHCEGDSWCYEGCDNSECCNDDEFCAHTFEMSECTKRNIEEATPLLGPDYINPDNF